MKPREFLIEDSLKKNIKILYKKNKLLYIILIKKINEIINSDNPNHYKNLRTPLQEFKRVHIKSSFVLIFKYDQTNNKIVFYELEHHDKIYKF